MARGRKGKVYKEDKMREAINMYADASISFSKILLDTGVPQLVLERHLAQNGLEKIRRHRPRKHVNGDQVSNLILAGKSIKAVSEQLHMTAITVKTHMSKEAWGLFHSRKRRGPAPKADNTGTRKLAKRDVDLSQDDKLKTALKMYMDTQLSFKEIQDATGVPIITLKGYIANLETIINMSKN